MRLEYDGNSSIYNLLWKRERSASERGERLQYTMAKIIYIMLVTMIMCI